MRKMKRRRVESDKVKKLQRTFKVDERVDTSRVSDIRRGLVSASNVGKIRRQIYQSKKEKAKNK